MSQVERFKKSGKRVPSAKVKALIASVNDEVAKVFNFEHDLVTARVQDPLIDSKVNQIDKYMYNVRKTYKDPDYLRDPIAPY